MQKEYKQVNDEGFVIESFVFDNVHEAIPPDCHPVWGTDLSFFTPKWDSQKREWVEGRENQEVLQTLREIKEPILKNNCQQNLVYGFKQEILGVVYHFTYDIETQMNFQDTYNLFQNNLLEEVNWTVRLNGEKKRIKLNKSSFTLVYTSAIKHKNECLNHLYEVVLPKLEAAQTAKEIDSVVWGKKENELDLNMNEMLDKKINEIALIEKETSAQKGHNMYIETTLMEVVDIIFGSM